MAGVSADAQAALQICSSLQAASCPLVEDLHLQDVDGLLRLLVTPSRCRTNILSWICTRVNPASVHRTAAPEGVQDQDALEKEMAALGQELMLCRADDVDLIRGKASPQRQLRFLEQLLSVARARPGSLRHSVDGELLLNELFGPESLPLLRQMIKPTLDPWPAHTHRKASPRRCRAEVADVAALLQSARSQLKELQSKCQFLSRGAPTAAGFTPDVLRVAAGDLHQLMATFSHVYESDLRAYCGTEPPSFSRDPDAFHRVHQLLLHLNTELEMLKEVSEASASVSREVRRLQAWPQYWSRGKKCTLAEQLLETSRGIRELLLPLQSSCGAPPGTSALSSQGPV